MLIVLAEVTFKNAILKAYDLHYKAFLFCYIAAMLLLGNVAVSIMVCMKRSNGAACWVSNSLM